MPISSHPYGFSVASCLLQLFFACICVSGTERAQTDAGGPLLYTSRQSLSCEPGVCSFELDSRWASHALSMCMGTGFLNSGPHACSAH